MQVQASERFIATPLGGCPRANVNCVTENGEEWECLLKWFAALIANPRNRRELYVERIGDLASSCSRTPFCKIKSFHLSCPLPSIPDKFQSSIDFMIYLKTERNYIKLWKKMESCQEIQGSNRIRDVGIYVCTTIVSKMNEYFRR